MRNVNVSSYILLFFSALCLSACQSTNESTRPTPSLLDANFPEYSSYKIESSEEIFALDDAMKSFINTNTAEQSGDKAKLTHLIKAIFGQAQLSLSYQAGANSTAIETFHQGAANCLSLTIMMYAMSEHLNMRSQFQNIDIPEYWTRRMGQTMINHHINLKVYPRESKNKALLVDFDPQENIEKLDATLISKANTVSLFYSNKASDYMLKNDANKAYAYLRAAIKKDPTNTSAWLNLGVLSSQNKLYQQADSYYRMALYLKPGFSSAYENLALLYERQGKAQKAKQILKQLHKKRLANPYYHMINGDLAMENNAYSKAIQHYKSAISLNNLSHEFHFKLAKAYFENGDINRSQTYLEKAMMRTKDKRLSERYASKLSDMFTAS